jgi:hypothetical protein
MEEPHRRDEGTQPPTSSRWWGFPGVDPAQERIPTGYICPTLQRGAWDRSMARTCWVILTRKGQSHASCGRTARDGVLRSSCVRHSRKIAWTAQMSHLVLLVILTSRYLTRRGRCS